MFAYIRHPDISPEIIHLFGRFGIRWYSLMYLLGFLFVYYFIQFLIKRKKVKLTNDQLSDIIFYGFFGVLLGGRLGYVLFYNLPYYLSNPLKIFAVWEGGMSFHGGFLGVLIAIFIWCLVNKKHFIDVMDVVAIPTPLALGFGRWGNFVNQELWGKPTMMPWGVIFPRIPQEKYFPVSEEWVKNFAKKVNLEILPGMDMINLPRHPSQIYEMLLEGVVLFSLMILFYNLKERRRGFYCALFLIGYGIARFFVEFFREPDEQIGYIYGNWLTMGILLSLPMILAGIIFFVYTFQKKENNRLWVE